MRNVCSLKLDGPLMVRNPGVCCFLCSSGNSESGICVYALKIDCGCINSLRLYPSSRSRAAPWCSGYRSHLTARSSWFKSQLGRLCVEFVCAGFLWTSSRRPETRFIVVGRLESPHDPHRCECESLPAADDNLFTVNPHWDKLQQPCDLERSLLGSDVQARGGDSSHRTWTRVIILTTLESTWTYRP